VSGFDEWLLDAFDHALWPVAIAVALLVGAAHALRPGHGKTLVAAYLVAEHGRWMHAAALAVIVAGLHTVSVLVIGLLWWAFAGERAVTVEPVAVWGRLAVALMVLAIGAVVLRRQWRAFVRRHAQAGAHLRASERSRADAHEHGHEHGLGHGFGDGHDDNCHHIGDHVHDHGHSHGPAEGVAPWSWAGLFGIASAGALIPSPAAFLLLVSGLLTGRAALAVVMVACFGVGLAATVLAVGLMVIAGRDWVRRRAGGRLARFGAVAPLLGAAAVVCGGCVLSATALAALVA
jgi:nickel/cobalt exporter